MERKKQDHIQNEDHRVWASCEMMINLGNYENIKIQAGELRTINPKEKASEAREEIIDALLEELGDYKKGIKE